MIVDMIVDQKDRWVAFSICFVRRGNGSGSNGRKSKLN